MLLCKFCIFLLVTSVIILEPIRRPVDIVGVPIPAGPQSTVMFPQQGTVIAVPNAPMIGN
jgi:hypothetical protein